MVDTNAEKPYVQLSGEDGNAYMIVGRCASALKEAGRKEDAKEIWDRLDDCKSYDAVLTMVQEYVEVG